MHNKIWYAVMMDKDDNDWGTGSFDLTAAKQRARQMRDNGYPDAHIVVIDDGDDPVAIDVITDIDD